MQGPFMDSQRLGTCDFPLSDKRRDRSYIEAFAAKNCRASSVLQTRVSQILDAVEPGNGEVLNAVRLFKGAGNDSPAVWP